MLTYIQSEIYRKTVRAYDLWNPSRLNINDCAFYPAVPRFESFGPIYYEYGSMVITYIDSDSAVKAFYALRESRHEDKTLLGKSRNNDDTLVSLVRQCSFSNL